MGEANMKQRATKLSDHRVDLAAELDKRGVGRFGGHGVTIIHATHTGEPISEPDGYTSHTSHMTRLWKAMGCPVGMSDATLIRKAAARINELERELKQRKDSNASFDQTTGRRNHT